MSSQPYSHLIRYKQWADRGLYDVIERSFGQLSSEDANIVLRILDHILTVDRIFQYHLYGLPNPFTAPRSADLPDIRSLSHSSCEVDEWYAEYVDALAPTDFDQPIDFTFSNGLPGRMSRGEIIMHVCLHGTYHRGNAGVLLQKSGIAPNDDRMTDFLGSAACDGHEVLPRPEAVLSTCT